MASILSRPQCVNQVRPLSGPQGEIPASRINRPVYNEKNNLWANIRSILSVNTQNRTHLSIKSLWPSDAIWRHISGSTLAQEMACLTAPSHYMNQCCLIISKVPWHSSEGIIIRSEETNHWIKIGNWIFRIASRFPRGQWVNIVATVCRRDFLLK